ncbi:MAG: hypothetical protein FJY85_10530, partial [Deltaproteobacteria bacterium]|nr:hypothetical protein [Deltaproteobacteria bacterium]
MTLRKQALGSILLTTMVLVAVLYWSSRSIILKGFSELESSHVRGTMEQVLGYVSRETVSLDAAISQWTAGKDASEIVKEAEPRVSGTEVGDGVLSALRLHVLVLISPEGQVVLSRSDGLGKDQESQIVSWIKEAFPASVKLYRQPDKVGASSGSVLLPEGPMLITARPLLAKPEREPFRGVLFAGRFLDLREIESLDRGMRLTVTRIEPEDRQGSGSIDRLCDGLSKDEPVCVRVTGPDQISGYVLLSDVHGAPEMVLTMDAPREIFERGRATVNYFLLSLVGVGLIFAAVIMFVLDRQIVSRL